MPDLQFTATIAGAPERIFETIADFPNYTRWLRPTMSFSATTEVTPLPVQLGTTYLDAGRAGARRGRVTEFDPPRHIAFDQPMRGPFGSSIGITARYTLEPQDGSTLVIRDVHLDFRLGVLSPLLEPLALPAFRTENDRVLRALKRYIEGGATVS